MRIFKMAAAALALAALGAGCAYKWTSDVPENMRTVSVPTFRNESSITALGDTVTRQVLREFQREGTFKIRRAGADDSALEVQGVVESYGVNVLAYDRHTSRTIERELTASAKVSVIDKRRNKVLVNDRVYRARTTFLAYDDIMSGAREASGRIAEDFARQIVDDVLALNYDECVSAAEAPRSEDAPGAVAPAPANEAADAAQTESNEPTEKPEEQP